MTGSTTREKQTQIILTFFNTLAEKKKRRVKLRNDTPLTAVVGEVAKAVEKSLFWPDFPVRKHSTIFQKKWSAVKKEPKSAIFWKHQKAMERLASTS